MAGNEALNFSIQTDVSSLPSIAAAFLVNFDARKGYSITWQRSITGVEVEGVVEFKSLPSGLHNVEEDLVYFIHEEYAGISAFVNRKDDEAVRNARMLAVGALVPLEHGRLGKSWRHAQKLKELALHQVDHPSNTKALDDYWEKNKLDDDYRPGSPVDSPVEFHKQGSETVANGYRKSRSMSTSSIYLSSEAAMPAHHPAATLLEFLQTFGPLIFPLYRAALLRKRILLMGEAPVEFACNIVYNLSILSSLPKVLQSLIPLDAPSNLKLRPLFNVGVFDIPLLEKPKSSHSDAYSDHGWIACSTDDVLSTKPELYDVVVLLPGNDSKMATHKIYPRLVASSPDLAKSFPRIGLRSTQRDAQRYRNLRRGLREFPPSFIEEPTVEADTVEEEEADGEAIEGASITSDTTSVLSNREIVESSSWARVAYTSLVWWASAGDTRSGLLEAEEADQERDMALLADDGDDLRTKEVALVAYFHRLTNLIFSTLSDAVSRLDENSEPRRDVEQNYHDDESQNAVSDSAAEETHELTGEEEQENEEEHLLSNSKSRQDDVEITEDDMTNMGLDVWSHSDREFVEEMVEKWWDRKAVVQGGSVQCCGVRIL